MTNLERCVCVDRGKCLKIEVNVDAGQLRRH